MASVVVLDAGALIALFDDSDGHHPWALQMFKDTITHRLAMSAINYAEALVHPTRSGKAQDFEAKIAGLEIELQDFSSGSAGRVALLRANTKLRMPDVISLDLALEKGADLATTDKTLGARALELGLGVYQP